MRDFVGKVLDLIYPIKCVICNSVTVKREDYVCHLCRDSLKSDVKVLYLKSSDTDNRQTICLSVFRYDDKQIKNAIWRFKFRGYRFYSEFFAKNISCEILRKFKNIKFDYICFVPLRTERKKNRGYNQAECLALDISKIINIPCRDVLAKVKNNHVQHELDLVDRIENVKGVYDVKTSLDVKGKVILLCDDIITSGSTLSECVKVLFKNGAKKVYCCTIAHNVKPDFLNNCR